VNFKKYTEMYQKDSTKVLGHKPELSKYDATILTTWDRSLRAAQRKYPMVSKFLGLCACLDHSDLCFSLFNFDAEELPVWLNRLCQDEQSIIELTGTLANLAFLQGNSGDDSYSIHPVVCEWLRRRLSVTEWVSIVSMAITLIGCSVPADTDPAYWITERRLTPHVEGCISLIEKNTETLSINPFIYATLFRLLYHQGRMKATELLYQKADVHSVQQGSPSTVGGLCLLENTAILRMQQGRFAEAEDIYLRLHTSMESHVSNRPWSALTLANMLNLAENYTFWGRLNDARVWYLHVLARYEIQPEADTRHFAACAWAGLGTVFAKGQDYEAAEVFYLAALAEWERLLATDNIITITITLGVAMNLSRVYEFQGKIDEAENSYSRCLQGFEAAHGPNSLSALRAAGNMARLLQFHRLRLTEAIQLYERALGGVRAELGADHAEVQALERNYSKCQRLQALVRARMETDRCTEAEACARIIAEAGEQDPQSQIPLPFGGCVPFK
jgi:tetratricopeptide (TPR) repeat protein